MKRIIIFLIRKKLGLKKMQHFRFTNQKIKEDYYYFDDEQLIKYDQLINLERPSSVSLNWLLNDKCEIEKGGK